MRSHSFLLATGLLLAWLPWQTQAAAENAAATKPPLAIAEHPAYRREAPNAPAGKTWLYQVALPFQVSPTQAGLFCNLREALAQGVDFEVGNDVITFSSIDEIARAQPAPLNRNQAEINPHTTPAGQPATMVKYPIRGGFVPLGAKLAGGAPHPAAGSGFGLSLAQAWRVLVPGPPPYQQNSYSGAESYSYWEFQQYEFDGTTFRVAGSQRVDLDKLLPGWSVPNSGMTNAIPDGADLLLALCGKTTKTEAGAARRSGAGVMRFRREGAEWRAITFQLVTGSEGVTEPSLVRDTDGALLFAGRGGREEGARNAIRVWRSRDEGATWENIIHVKDAVSPAPITLNQAADGSPFIMANLRAVMPGPRDPLTLAASAKRPLEASLNSRNTLNLWPLAPDRGSLLPPILVRDCRAEFGPPVTGSNWSWRADHPSAMTVRLADGKWHTLLGVRVQDYREIKEAMPPPPQTGMYVYEVLSAGAARPVWDF